VELSPDGIVVVSEEVIVFSNSAAAHMLGAAAPERLLGLPNLPSRVPEACVPELERLAKQGVKAVEFSVFDAAVPLYDRAWEPLWAAAEEAGIPLCAHIGDRWGTPYPPNENGRSRAHFSMVPFVAGEGITHVVFSGVLERHPNLKVCFAECRVGWIPFLISWMDRQIRERPDDPSAPLSMLPSEYIKRQVRFTFEDDIVGTKLIREPWSCLQETAMWGADYPHGQGVWPNPEPILDELFEGLDPAVKRAVVHDTAAEFFGIKSPVASQVAAAV
jgi:predicted TIM-barrel fold metal-dependent hydrolase